jgi:Carboxypeptidase regulatory-like domain
VRKAIVLCFVLAALCSAQSESGIEGRVTNQSGEPLKNATVRLRRVPAPPLEDDLAVDTREDGSFLFHGLSAGHYEIYAERLGYLFGEYGSPVTLSPGQRLTGISFKMTRAALVAGRVVDEDGDSIPNAHVTVLLGKPPDEVRSSHYGTARADGSFVIGDLSAGAYYLFAEVVPAGVSISREVSGPREDFVRTYYPGTPDASKATPIQIEAGAEVRDLEVRIRKSRLFRVAGKVIQSSTRAPMGNAVLTLQSLQMFLARPAPAVTAADGTFQFPRIPPGEYVLQSGQGMENVGSLMVTVAGSDVDDLILNVGPALEVSGKITLDGPGTVAQTRVDLIENFHLGRIRQPTFEKKDDGSFTIGSLDPWTYRVQVDPLPANAYVKSIHFGDLDVTSKDLDLMRGTGGRMLEIVLSAHAAEVSGTVRDSKGGIVSLWRDGFPKVTATTDQNGGFQFGNLAPGEYHLAAWNNDVPSDLRKFENQAVAVKLGEDSDEKIDPPLIAFDAK